MEEAIRDFKEAAENEWGESINCSTLLPRITEEYPPIQMLSNTIHNSLNEDSYSDELYKYDFVFEKEVTLDDCKKIANCICNMGFIMVFYKSHFSMTVIREDNHFDQSLIANPKYTPWKTHFNRASNCFLFLSKKRFQTLSTQPRMRGYCMPVQEVPRRMALTVREHAFLEARHWRHAKSGYLIAWRWRNGAFFHILKILVFFL
jgi:hypothetical protein